MPNEQLSDEPAPDDQYEYDVAVSFAGEDRTYVEDVVRRLKAADVKVFYDEDELATMWGENLVDLLQSVYERRARFALLFISSAYVQKKWTNHERQAAQDRALQQASPYILPVKLDSSELPGLHSTISYIDARHVGIEKLVELTLQKFGAERTSLPSTFDGKVPRTSEAVAALLEERPPAWEYLLFGAELRSGLAALEDKYRDHELEYAPTRGPAVEPNEIAQLVRQAVTALGATSSTMDRLLRGPAQEAAFGKPGEPGDPDRIAHLARRLVAGYEELLDRAAEIRSIRTLDETVSRVANAAAHYSDQPTAAFRAFVDEFVEVMDGAVETLMRGENITYMPVLTFKVPAEASEEFDAALEAFKAEHPELF